ncbi:MAG: hypothetical protein ACOCTG_06065 [Bacteroidota bacterium]
MNYRLIGATIVIAAVSLSVHLLFGWMWTALVAIAAGLVLKSRGWFVGMAGVAIGWAGLVVYSFSVAPYETAELLRIIGSLLGNLPAVVSVAATVSIGAVLGALGGLVGSTLRSAIAHSRPRNAESPT